MEARRGARRTHPGQVTGQPVQQRVASEPVDAAHAAEVAVELATLDEVGERQLVEGARPEVGRQLRAVRPAR